MAYVEIENNVLNSIDFVVFSIATFLALKYTYQKTTASFQIKLLRLTIRKKTKECHMAEHVFAMGYAILIHDKHNNKFKFRAFDENETIK